MHWHISCLLALFTFSTIAGGEGQTMLDPRQLLLDSLKNTATASIKATARYPEGKLRAQLSRKVNAEGRFLQKLDSYSKQGRKLTYITQDNDVFLLFKQDAYWLKWNAAANVGQLDPFRQVCPQIAQLDKTLDCQYVLSDDSYQNKPCYKVTVAIPLDDASLINFLKIPQKEIDQKRKEILRKAPSVLVFYIYKDNGMICSMTSYSTYGRLLGSANWNNIEVDFNAALEDRIFDVPKRRIVVKTQKELEKLFTDRVMNNK